jgi:hypothetical protein
VAAERVVASADAFVNFEFQPASPLLVNEELELSP